MSNFTDSLRDIIQALDRTIDNIDIAQALHPGKTIKNDATYKSHKEILLALLQYYRLIRVETLSSEKHLELVRETQTDTRE